MSTALTVLNFERAELGYVETPVNHTKYAGMAGHANGYAWCATFQVAMFRKAHMKLGNESAYTPSLYASLPHITGPRVGALAFFYFPSEGRIAHVGLVESVRSDGRFVSIEGNTDVAGGRTGGRVMRKVRSTVNVHFAMPHYDAPAVVHPVPTHPAAKPVSPVTAAPRWPLPAGYYFGPKTGPTQSVSGFYSHREDLRKWQNQMIRRGWKFGSSGADGLYGNDTARVVAAFRAEKHLGTGNRIDSKVWAAAWTAPRT